MNVRPFAYNPSGNISGTQQFGSLTVGTPTDGFESQSIKFWNGPDEDLGYVIAHPGPNGSHVGADGGIAYLGFTRSSIKTEASFLLLANKLFSQDFLTGDAAKTWLNANGYWTSWGLTTANPDGQWFFYSDEGVLDVGPPVNNGNVVFTRDNLSFETFNPNKTGEDSSNSIFFSLFDSNGNDYTTQFTDLQDNGGSLTITQGDQTVTYTSEGALFVFNVSTTPQGNFFFLNVIAATQTQIATADFNLTDPITITFNEGSQLPRAIITSNNEYISVDEGLYLAYNI